MSDNNLRLQVILNAVDKLTRPFRAAQASSKELAGAIQNTRNSLKELNKQAGRIDEFRKTRSQLAITANNLNAAREEAAKLATQFAATNRPTAAQAKLFSQAKTRVQELQQTYNGLLGAVQRQRQALKESGIDTRQLSSAQRELKKNAEETRQALEGQQKALKRLGEQQARMNAAREQYSRRLEVRDRIAGAGATTTAAGLVMGAPVMAAVKSYTSMEDAMKGVAKQVNGLRDDNGNRTARFYEMQDAIKAASEQLPMENGAVDFAALVEGGARMNVANPDDSWEDQKRDLLAFASTAAKAATAFELPADELSESLGKIAQLYKIPTRNIEQLGDALNYLDDTVGLGTLAVALAAVLGPLAVIRLGFSVLGIKTLPSVTAAVTRTSSALSWLAGAPLALLRRGLASSGNAAGLLTAPLSSLRRTASLTGNVLKTVAGAPVALLRSGLSGLRAVAVMFMNPLAALRGGLTATGAVLRVLASGPLAMLRVALYAISGLLGALLSPIGLVVTALAGVALVVWKYWQPITAFLGGVVEGFKAAAGPISAAFEPLKPVFQWIGDKVQALWGWFTDLLMPVKSTSAELQSAAAMGRRFGEALAEGLNMVMHPLDSLKSGVSWLLDKLGIVSKEAAKAKLPESVTRQQPATVNADGKVMMPSGGFPSWGYGFAGMYDSGGYIPRGQFGIVGENGPEIVNGPANVTSRRNTAALAAVVVGMMGVAAAPAELPPLHPLALPAKGGEAMVSRAAAVPPVHRIEAPTQIIIQTQPGQSAQDIAREVARQLDERERRLKAKARSNYSDQGGYDA
ncbi:phage tail tape measure protein [Escherichia coli]|uniref:phage tail tape measure protein n=1 Tax=Escherichia coli TaxID=562 RepID=UPI000BE9697F|nr:phage tail tape measure protein [Escherichia coli]PDS14870.1 phage tail tape measure protein [Escherichia coli]